MHSVRIPVRTMLASWPLVRSEGGLPHHCCLAHTQSSAPPPTPSPPLPHVCMQPGLRRLLYGHPDYALRPQLTQGSKIEA